MPTSPDLPLLTPALEDYLETVFRLVARHGAARVRDIAAARNVKPGSVSPAMKRLDELGLIRYERGESVGLTDTGLAAARKVYSRHQVLHRFLGDVLGLPADVAENDACSMEHSLSPQTVDAVVRFLEYMEVCPEASADIARFRRCSAVHPEVEPCPHECSLQPLTVERSPVMSIARMEPGQQGRVRQIGGRGAVRQRLLDMGLLPDVTLMMERKAPTGDPVWIRLQGFEMALRRSEAELVTVETG